MAGNPPCGFFESANTRQMCAVCENPSCPGGIIRRLEASLDNIEVSSLIVLLERTALELRDSMGADDEEAVNPGS